MEPRTLANSTISRSSTFHGRPGVHSCAERHRFSSVVGQLHKKARSPLHNVGSILRSDHLRVCRVSAMMITLSFTSMSCNKNVSSEHTSAGLSCHHPKMGRVRKRRSDHSEQIHSSILLQNRQLAVVRSSQDRILLRNVLVPSYSLQSLESPYT